MAQSVMKLISNVKRSGSRQRLDLAVGPTIFETSVQHLDRTGSNDTTARNNRSAVQHAPSKGVLKKRQGQSTERIHDEARQEHETNLHGNNNNSSHSNSAAATMNGKSRYSQKHTTIDYKSNQATIYFNTAQDEDEIDEQVNKDYEALMVSRGITSPMQERSTRISFQLNDDESLLSTRHVANTQSPILQRRIRALEQRNDDLQQQVRDMRNQANAAHVHASMKVANLTIDLESLREDKECWQQKCEELQWKLRQARMEQAAQQLELQELRNERQQYQRRVQIIRRSGAGSGQTLSF